MRLPNSQVRSQRANGAGFTLVELLVVLVLLGLISSLLMQGFTYVLQLRLRFAAHLQQQQVGRLQEHWFRTLVAGITPDREDGQHIFQGQSTTMRGLTLGSLTVPGTPTPFTLDLPTLDRQMELHYQLTPQDHWVLVRESGAAAEFSYRDRQGVWHESWPPEEEAAEQLPVAVQLFMPRQPEPLQWIVAIAGRREPKPDIRDLL
jgi:general secretion pathway protein J